MRPTILLLMISFVGCCLVGARPLKWDAVFPLDVGPVMAVVRFRTAVTLGEIKTAYECLTPTTRKKMSKTRFELAIATNYEVEYEGHKIPLRDFICEAKLIDVQKKDNYAEVLLEWGRMWVTILCWRINEYWYIGLYESLRGWK